MKGHLTFVFALLLICTGAGAALAQSQETVCDGLIGAAHGLCTAYCGAMDCDSGTPQASQIACGKVRDNFARITGQGLPCDCPCVGGYPGFIETLNGENGTLLSCNEVPDPGSELVVLYTSGDFLPVAAIAPEAFCGNFNTVTQFITAEQGQACHNLIKQKAAAAGIECVPFP